MSEIKKSKNSSLTYVKTKSTLKRAQRLQDTINEITDKVNELAVNDHDDPNYIRYICELIENISSIELKGEEKLKIALQVITNKFPILNNERDMARVTKLINHFVENGDIQKVATSKIVTKGIISFILKKVLG